MRLMSFSLTTKQMRARTKTVTRRVGWTYLKPGDLIQACEKVMGRRNGQPLVRIGVIRILSVQRQPLSRMVKELDWGFEECRREGFPAMNPFQFRTFFCESHGLKQNDLGETDAVITRIEFEHVTP